MVRLPLHVGVDTLWRIAAASAVLVPAVAFAVSGVMLAVDGNGGGTRIAAGVVGVLVSIALIGLAWYARASDVVLDDAGIGIQGGRWGGRKLAWGAIGEVVLHNVDKPDADHVLELRTRTGEKLVLAEAADASEKASVGALHETLCARLGALKEPLPRRADLAVCRTCGAPLLPSDQEQVRCGSCGTANPVERSVRERVAAHRAAEQAASATSAAVATLMNQPGAGRASAVLVAVAAASAMGWLPVIGAWLLVGIRSVGWFELGLGLFNGWALTFGFFAVARMALARRRALHLLVTTFGARPPEHAGQSPGCRSCGAPLATGTGIVVRCVYCDTQSVLGITVRPLMRRVQAYRGSIEDVLRDQSSERTRWIALAAAGLVATAVAGLWLVVQVAVAYDVAQTRSRCEAGKAEACFELARSYAIGSTVDKDEEAAYRYFVIGCDRGHAEACSDAAMRQEMGWGTERNAALARATRAKSCRLGFKQACDETKR